MAIPGIALLLVGVLGLAFNSITEGAQTPYEQKVLAIHGQLPQGQDLFERNCSSCHGTEANGWIGPNLHDVKKRKSDVQLIRQVTSGQTPPMPKFELNERQMADLLSYLKSL
ncbi:c-type cytochrome [Gloeobacter kilaueensis]|uniref:Cytochrome cM n=1 Tax=Gloeobacter kilaueensis (strain ATCC BAA-2537 / CCAP 1431/1 / ULC 316 / JS1) TaxID=1183438 RepID=U5QS42_GLOK1|nr:cytochrome c [Gloeobacter kilaueensis]AGY60515.1 cytochrome cM [Gloeobacter kilaueensis JS1]